MRLIVGLLTGLLALTMTPAHATDPAVQQPPPASEPSSTVPSNDAANTSGRQSNPSTDDAKSQSAAHAADSKGAASSQYPTGTKSTSTSAATSPSAANLDASKQSAEKPASVDLNSKTPINAGERRLLASGYKLQIRNGRRLWCHHEEVLGSRLQGGSRCDTEEQINSTQRDSEELMNRNRLQSGVAPCK